VARGRPVPLLAPLPGVVREANGAPTVRRKAGVHAGAPFGYGAWLGWSWYTVLLNMAGGLVVVTFLRFLRFLRLLRSKNLIEAERRQAKAGP
jgi:fatty acid desaturase